jgi:outer membrane protein assembly factor BamB
VTKTHVLWRGRDRSRIATPVYDDGRLYWVSGRTASCIDAGTGKLVYQEKLGGGSAEIRSGSASRGRGGRSGQDYSSPVLADGKIYYVTRSGEAFVYAVGPEFKLLAENRFGSDGGDFSSTPAVSDGSLFVRSGKYLYCIARPTR